MNLLDTGVNHEHIRQPRQTHPPVATVDANVLSTYIIISCMEPDWPVFWLELGPCFGEWNRFKIVDIQRFLTLPTPNLSHPTASLSGLLCGLRWSQLVKVSQLAKLPIWWKHLVGDMDVPCLEDFMKENCHLEHLPGLGKFKNNRL